MATPAAQRNRIHIDGYLLHDQIERRIAAAVAAGGRVISDKNAPGWWTLADPGRQRSQSGYLDGRLMGHAFDNRGARSKGLESAAPAQRPHSSSSLVTVAQLRAVPPTRAEVGPPALASTRRSSLGGYPSGVCK